MKSISSLICKRKFHPALLVLCLVTLVHSATLPKTAKLVPPQTVFLIDIEDFSKFDADFKKTPFYGLYKDPEMTAFAEHAKGKWHQTIKELDENNIFRALAEGNVWPKGRFAMAFIDLEQNEDSNELPVLLISQWGENITKIKEMVSKMMSKNVEMGGHKKTSLNFRGVNIESAVDEKGVSFGYCFIDDCFIGGTSVEGLKYAIAHIKGATSNSLADDTNYMNTIKGIGADENATIYVNIAHIIKRALAEDSQGQVQTYLSNLGVDKVAAFGMSLDIQKSRAVPLEIKALLKVNGIKTKLLKLLEPQTSYLKVPRFVSSEATSIAFVNINMQQAFGEFIKILTFVDPRIAAFFYSPLTEPGSDGKPGITVKSDIIDHLGTGLIFIQTLKKPFADNPFGSEYIFAIATNNRNALEKSLAQLHEKKVAQNDPQAKRELLGHTIYIIRFSGLGFTRPDAKRPFQTEQEQPAIPRSPTVAFTVTDTHLIVGFESSVEQAIRTLHTGESITDAKWFSQAKTSVPAQTGMVSFENMRSTAEFIWWLFKESKTNPRKVSRAAPNAGYFIIDSDLDFSLLGEFEKVKKYFGTGVFHMISRDDGFFAESKIVNQP